MHGDGPNGEKGSSWAAVGHAGGKGGGDGLGRTEPGLGRFGLMGLGFILFYFLFQTLLNLKPFEFKFKFEFNSSTQTKRTMHQHECNNKC